MQHVEPAAAEPREVEAVGKPGGKAEHPLDTRRVRASHRDGAAHREADEQRPQRPDGCDRGPRVLLAPLQASPRLHAIPDLGEDHAGKARREARDEPFQGRAPRPGHIRGLAAVDADDRELAGRSGDAHLGTSRERDQPAGHALVIRSALEDGVVGQDEHAECLRVLLTRARPAESDAAALRERSDLRVDGLDAPARDRG